LILGLLDVVNKLKIKFLGYTTTDQKVVDSISAGRANIKTLKSKGFEGFIFSLNICVIISV